ncbi:MAG: NAD(P)H-dependent glycerol-3-phosphate dehydrogenase [Acetilactobacillus jinshanensis]
MNRKSEKVSVLGAGSWGSMLANLLYENGYHVSMWSIDPKQVKELNTKHTNERYMKGFVYPKGLVTYNDMNQAVKGADDVFVVVPAQATRSTAKNLNQCLVKDNLKPNVIDASKGIEKGTYDLMYQVLDEELDSAHVNSLAVLSGPTQAESVAIKDITLVTVSSKSQKSAEHFQKMLMAPYFRVYTNNDVVGTETGAAMKNIIAIGAGALASMGYKDNATAALMTRGLAEIERLGKAFGANPLTFTGLSGLGDLIVTATSSNSRNWRAGYQLGQGKTPKDIVANMGQVVEGAATVKAAHDLAQEKQIDMPITNAIYQVWYKNANIKDEIKKLMQRPARPEFY